MTLKKFGYNFNRPNLFNYIYAKPQTISLDNNDMSGLGIVSFKENKKCDPFGFTGFGKQYEIKNMDYMIQERVSKIKKHVFHTCYRLMWNLKNTDKVKRNFDEIESIYFDTVKVDHIT